MEVQAAVALVCRALTACRPAVGAPAARLPAGPLPADGQPDREEQERAGAGL